MILTYNTYLFHKWLKFMWCVPPLHHHTLLSYKWLSHRIIPQHRLLSMLCSDNCHMFHEVRATPHPTVSPLRHIFGTIICFITCKHTRSILTLI